MKPLVIGIAGGSGSGKTTVTNMMVEKFDPRDVTVIQHDSYYHDFSRYKGKPASEINFDHPDSLETSLLTEHLKVLKGGGPIQQPVYDFATHSRKKEQKTVDPKPIIIVEGILVFVEKELRDLMDIKIFVDTDADERLLRRLKRDLLERGRSVDSVIHQYISSVKPMHQEFVEPSKRWADVIIPGGADNGVAIDQVIAKIKSLIGST